MKLEALILCIIVAHAPSPAAVDTCFPCNSSILQSHIPAQQARRAQHFPYFSDIREGAASQAVKEYVAATLAAQRQVPQGPKESPKGSYLGMLCFSLSDKELANKYKKRLEEIRLDNDSLVLLDQLPLCSKRGEHGCDVAPCIKRMFTKKRLRPKKQKSLYCSLVKRALCAGAVCSLQQLQEYRNLICFDLLRNLAEQVNKSYKIETFLSVLPFSTEALATCLINESVDLGLPAVGKDVFGLIAEFSGHNYLFSLLSDEKKKELKEQLLHPSLRSLGIQIGLLPRDAASLRFS